MTYHPRTLAATLTRALTTFPAVAVVGPRQTGKTTLLQSELVSHRYVSLERPDVRARALADPVAFIAENPPPVILDEIQYAPALLHYVKDYIDADRRPGGFVLTGSQGFPLMRDLAQTLAGRVAILRLDPVSASEALAAPEPASLDDLIERVFAPPGSPMGEGTSSIDLVEWLLRGAYPEPRFDPRVDRQLWLASYIQTYLDRDVRDLLRVSDLSAFGRLLALFAARTGAELNLTALGRDVGVTGPTVRSWVSVLEATGILTLLPPYHRNFGKRITKSPRVYLADPGLVTFLTGLHTADAVRHGPMLGPLVEAAVVQEWQKAYHHRGERPELFYWRSTGGAEVDVVIERNARLFGIEVKATATPTPHHAAGLRRWLDLAGPEARGVLACQVAAPFTVAPGIRAVPWHLAW